MRKSIISLALRSAAILLACDVRGAVPADLALEVSTEKPTYAPYEPVVLRYALENRGKETIEVSGLVGTQGGAVTFEVTDTKGEFRRYRTGPIVCGVADNRLLQPNNRVRGQVIMISNQFANLQNAGSHLADVMPPYPFAAAGTYALRATHLVITDRDRDERSALVSEPTTIKVREANRREREAMAFWGSPSELALAMGAERMGSAAATPDDRDMETAVLKWEEFVARFGDTPYAPFVRLNLAATYRHDPRIGRPRPDLAIKHLRAVAETGPRSVADDALFQLAEAALENNEIEEATRASAELLRTFPDSERTADAKRIADGLRTGYRSLKEIYSHP